MKKKVLILTISKQWFDMILSGKKPMISDSYDNPVDACVKMIIKLNELKML